MISHMLSTRDRTARRLRWLVFNLRWVLILLAAGVLLGLREARPLDGRALILLIVLGGYQAMLALLEFIESWPRLLQTLTLGLDVVLTLSLFAVSGGADSRLMWIGLLPALTVGLRQGWAAGLIVLVLFTLAQAGILWLMNPGVYGNLVTLGIYAAVLWPAAVIVALIASRVRSAVYIRLEGEQRAEALRSQILRDHARAIYEMASMASATLDYEKVLEAALNFGLRGSERNGSTSGQMVCAVLMFEDDQLHVTSSRRFATADDRKVCPGREGVLGNVIRTGDPLVIDNPAHDPELKQYVAFQNCRSLMALPLRAGFETYGVVVYGHPNPTFFDPDQRALLSAVVNQATIALQNAQLYRNLRAEKERLIDVQEEAQKKLARDLHDGPTQAVAALAMRSNFVRRLIDRDPKVAAEELFKMEDLARRTTKEIRHMLFTLRPLVLENQGLVAALQQLAEKMRETHNQNVIVEAEAGADEFLEKNHQGVLFYIVEEAVNNARKHAQAEHIWIRLKTQRDIMTCEIQDDGVGFNLGAVDANYDKRGSLGLVNMRERAEMLGGVVKMTSSEGKGTRISIYVPLTEEARDRMRAG
jgi:signal transduction histidine kinase